MKIALVTSSFLPQVGGAEMVVHNLALQWVRQGCGGWTRLDQRDSGHMSSGGCLRIAGGPWRDRGHM